ncbi:MAG: glycerol-3-phosphate acyltransferase [Chloroflexota bacterium]
MDLLITLIAAVVGYILGSISFARIVANWVVPGEDITKTEIKSPVGDQVFEMTSVSATSISFRRGPKYGCLIGLLDILKATIPVLFFKLAFPNDFYFLITAVMCVVGHNFPLQHRFKGGRGVSPILGGLIVVDFLAVPVTLILSIGLGLVVFRDVLIAYTGFIPLLVLWFWLRFDEPAYLLYALAINFVFWPAMWPELIQYIQVKRSGDRAREQDFWAQLEVTDMGRSIKHLRRFGLIKDNKRVENAEADQSLKDITIDEELWE